MWQCPGIIIIVNIIMFVAMPRLSSFIVFSLFIFRLVFVLLPIVYIGHFLLFLSFSLIKVLLVFFFFFTGPCLRLSCISASLTFFFFFFFRKLLWNTNFVPRGSSMHLNVSWVLLLVPWNSFNFLVQTQKYLFV